MTEEVTNLELLTFRQQVVQKGGAPAIEDAYFETDPAHRLPSVGTGTQAVMPRGRPHPSPCDIRHPMITQCRHDAPSLIGIAIHGRGMESAQIHPEIIMGETKTLIGRSLHDVRLVRPVAD